MPLLDIYFFLFVVSILQTLEQLKISSTSPVTRVHLNETNEKEDEESPIRRKVPFISSHSFWTKSSPLKDSLLRIGSPLITSTQSVQDDHCCNSQDTEDHSSFSKLNQFKAKTLFSFSKKENVVNGEKHLPEPSFSKSLPLSTQSEKPTTHSEKPDQHLIDTAGSLMKEDIERTVSNDTDKLSNPSLDNDLKSKSLYDDRVKSLLISDCGLDADSIKLHPKDSQCEAFQKTVAKTSRANVSSSLENIKAKDSDSSFGTRDQSSARALEVALLHVSPRTKPLTPPDRCQISKRAFTAAFKDLSSASKEENQFTEKGHSRLLDIPRNTKGAVSVSLTSLSAKTAITSTALNRLESLERALSFATENFPSKDDQVTTLRKNYDSENPIHVVSHVKSKKRFPDSSDNDSVDSSRSVEAYPMEIIPKTSKYFSIPEKMSSKKTKQSRIDLLLRKRQNVKTKAKSTTSELTHLPADLQISTPQESSVSSKSACTSLSSSDDKLSYDGSARLFSSTNSTVSEINTSGNESSYQTKHKFSSDNGADKWSNSKESSSSHQCKSASSTSSTDSVCFPLPFAKRKFITYDRYPFKRRDPTEKKSKDILDSELCDSADGDTRSDNFSLFLSPSDGSCGSNVSSEQTVHKVPDNRISPTGKSHGKEESNLINFSENSISSTEISEHPLSGVIFHKSDGSCGFAVSSEQTAYIVPDNKITPTSNSHGKEESHLVHTSENNVSSTEISERPLSGIIFHKRFLVSNVVDTASIDSDRDEDLVIIPSKRTVYASNGAEDHSIVDASGGNLKISQDSNKCLEVGKEKTAASSVTNVIETKELNLKPCHDSASEKWNVSKIEESTLPHIETFLIESSESTDFRHECDESVTGKNESLDMSQDQEQLSRGTEALPQENISALKVEEPHKFITDAVSKVLATKTVKTDNLSKNTVELRTRAEASVEDACLESNNKQISPADVELSGTDAPTADGISFPTVSCPAVDALREVEDVLEKSSVTTEDIRCDSTLGESSEDENENNDSPGGHANVNPENDDVNASQSQSQVPTSQLNDTEDDDIRVYKRHKLVPPHLLKLKELSKQHIENKPHEIDLSSTSNSPGTRKRKHEQNQKNLACVKDFVIKSKRLCVSTICFQLVNKSSDYSLRYKLIRQNLVSCRTASSRQLKFDEVYLTTICWCIWSIHPRVDQFVILCRIQIYCLLAFFKVDFISLNEPT